MTTKIRPSTLENTAVTAGTYGGSGQIPAIIVDAQGRITYAANVTPSIATSQLTGTVSATQIANNQTYGINVSGTAGGVAWTNVSSRPTALSSFTNDLGNYGGWITGVSWTDVSGRPTALSSFTNDSGYITGNQVYSGSTVNNLTFPIGTTIVAYIGGGTPGVNSPTIPNRNATPGQSGYVGIAGNEGYNTSVAPSNACTGTWRSRGYFAPYNSYNGTAEYWVIWQRVA